LNGVKRIIPYGIKSVSKTTCKGSANRCTQCCRNYQPSSSSWRHCT